MPSIINYNRNNDVNQRLYMGNSTTSNLLFILSGGRSDSYLILTINILMRILRVVQTNLFHQLIKENKSLFLVAILD
jgi:hypothetical protein